MFFFFYVKFVSFIYLVKLNLEIQIYAVTL